MLMNKFIKYISRAWIAIGILVIIFSFIYNIQDAWENGEKYFGGKEFITLLALTLCILLFNALAGSKEVLEVGFKQFFLTLFFLFVCIVSINNYFFWTHIKSQAERQVKEYKFFIVKRFNKNMDQWENRKFNDGIINDLDMTIVELEQEFESLIFLPYYIKNGGNFAY